MICPVCGDNRWEFERKYHKLDKYEQWCSIPDPICRAWYKCLSCGHYKARHSYNVRALEHIYTNGYRSVDFRGASVEDEFRRIINLPYEHGENKKRVKWLEQFISVGQVTLDVGAGLGVFLAELHLVARLCCGVEPNKDSARFITEKLRMKCIESFYKPSLYDEVFDWIACIHVLEHQQDPEQMLLDFQKDLKPDGKIYIEVPDATEFESLDKDNDEFNSTHLHFFTLSSLCQLVESCGYKVTDLKRAHHKVRNLERIMLVAEL